ncbi:hypothetical protein FVE85_4678 [Porphyridium purpureum]|uniref:Uncharacterized protein n=1 Tax=Porphyridium purpureum TaxID=35688 RepID=A0A5J4YPV9_PORPP|nr:hypothetical protein FVE85_4678 [Porphyridium purpureum]|eukprot:POR6314..scf236_6
MDAKLFELPDADDTADIQIISGKQMEADMQLRQAKTPGSAGSHTGAASGAASTESEQHKVTPRPQDLQNMISEHEDQIRIWNEKKQKEKAAQGSGSGAMKSFLTPSSPSGFSMAERDASSSRKGSDTVSPGRGSGSKQIFGLFKKK